MEFSLIYYVNSVALGIGLAMDSFCVSIANGITYPNMKKRKALGISFTFAFFQALMPMIGYICVKTVADKFAPFQKIVPYISLILLGFIGGKMIAEGIKGNTEEAMGQLTARVVLIQAVATSIDALSVGFTISNLSLFAAVVENIIIALVTFATCALGNIIGKTIGNRWSRGASVLGGVILVLIGVEIFITSFF